jgi:protocatechuate 4,5-dioxygenase beta chain
MFEPAERWPAVYAGRPEYTRESQPHTAALETPEVVASYVARIDAGFETLRRELEAYRPDALLILGDDQREMFDESCNPTFYLFTGERAWGLEGTPYRPREERRRVKLVCHAELARLLLAGLVERGFDMAGGEVLQPLGRPDGGMPHMVANPVPRVTPRLDVPIVPLFINEYYPPLPTAARCYQLGVALAEILAERPERVAIYASGGLSHDPIGPRAGWVDEPLDRWLLERLERNDGAALQRLYGFDSDTLRGGTGEIRAWIAVAGAMQRPARVVDYIRAHHAKTGLAFAYWPGTDGEY